MSDKSRSIVSAGGERSFVKPQTKIVAPTPQALDYLQSARGLRHDTINAYRLGCTEGGKIALPHYDEADEHVLTTFRAPDGGLIRIKDKETKTFAEPGGRHVLFGSHLCDPAEGPLVICAGHYDAMSVAQAGVPNATSLPFGDSAHQFIENQFDWLEQFREIIIWPDADDHRDAEAAERAWKKQDEMAVRLGKARVKIVRVDDKDANDLMRRTGADAVREAVQQAKWYAGSQIVDVADWEEPDALPEGTPTAWGDIDSTIGGFRDGEITVWGGDNFAGKSTALLNVTCANVAERVPTLFWSGEQKIKALRRWFELVAAGPLYLESRTATKTGLEYFIVKPEMIAHIRDWYRGQFFILDEEYMTPEVFFELLEIAVRRYGIKAAIVDNLMAFTSGVDEFGYYAAQGAFVQSCKNFAAKFGIHIHLIAHNKKQADFGHMPEKDDVEGSKKITNWAHNLIQVWRVPHKKREGELAETDTVFRVLKSRESGQVVECRMVFNVPSKRLVQLAERECVAREMGWERRAGIELPEAEEWPEEAIAF
jgi:hypothetical protein